VTARARVVVRGFVQGVGFRVSTRARAASLGLAGWVANRADGSVEAVFEGKRDRVESMLDWCGRGPAGSRVAAVEAAWEEPRGEVGFRVR
jgi:acylphosphatase